MQLRIVNINDLLKCVSIYKGCKRKRVKYYVFPLDEIRKEIQIGMCPKIPIRERPFEVGVQNWNFI